MAAEFRSPMHATGVPTVDGRHDAAARWRKSSAGGEQRLQNVSGGPAMGVGVSVVNALSSRP